jgi:hypothetical protein
VELALELETPVIPRVVLVVPVAVVELFPVVQLRAARELLTKVTPVAAMAAT